MSVYQLQQEGQCQRVEEYGNTDADLELEDVHCLVVSHEATRFGVIIQLLDNDDVSCQVHETHQERHYEHFKEVGIIGLSNAIIDPVTVMVKSLGASVALATMLGF